MRIVRYEPQERVDMPDKVAENFLVLGEFRRTIRSLIIGEEANYVIRGFAVEPESPASARVVVRLDNTTGLDSLAVGAENTGTAVYGQLIGDRDDEGNTEGNAQQILDFTAQAAATYRVQLRFIYTTGINDNRAFWDEATDSESIGAMDTRHLPGWEVRLSGSASDEWIDLADVVWDGVSIDAADITDVRTFAFEGAAPYTRATQDGAGALADFSRATTRGTDGINTVYGVLRALARQIQDIKGAADDGTWSWFARPFKPLDPAGALDPEITKNLRSVDHVTYACGDGATTWGDFNGAGALDACLAHVAAIPLAQLPQRITIVLKTLQVDNTFQFTLNTAHTIGETANPCTLTIRGETGGSTAALDYNVYVAATTPVSGTSLIVRGNLIVENVAIVMTGTASERSLLGATGYVRARNCSLIGETASATTVGWLIQSDATGLHLENCTLSGRINAYDTGSVDLFYAKRGRGALIERCTWTNAHLKTRGTSGDYATTGFVIRDCSITGRLGTPYTSNPAVLDFRGASQVTVESCELQWVDFENCIHSDEMVNGSGATLTPRHFKIRNNKFTRSGSSAHAVSAGVHGADGTGWGVYVEDGSDIQVTGNYFAGTTTSNATYADAGAIAFGNTFNFTVADNTIIAHTHVVAGQVTGVRIFNSESGSVRGNRIIGWGTPSGTVTIRGLHLGGTSRTEIAGNTLDGNSVPLGATSGGLILDTADDCTITGNTIRNWNPGAAASLCVILSTAATRCTFQGNTFEFNGGYAIAMEAAGTSSANQCTFTGNVFRGTDPDENGISLGLASSSEECSFTGNVGQFTGGGTRTLIDVGGCSSFAVFANASIAGRLVTSSGSGVGASLTYNQVAAIA